MDDDIAQEEDWYSADAATFGDRVAGAREALGMTQPELSKRLGVKLKTIRSWEDDLEGPRANKLQMLSGVLNVSVMWLLNGQGDGLTGPDVAVLPADVRDLLTELRQLRTQMCQNVERLTLLEKRLRHTLKDQI
ncbi:MAG: helix-turn-helix domain-containing protein [Marinosulfonomonas sp.]|nr:helix-turn-helix domain-containing protein [Marinosulfonomonas sp.]